MELTQPPDELPHAVGPVSFLACGEGRGAKTRGAGKRGVLVTAVEVEKKGGRFKYEEH